MIFFKFKEHEDLSLRYADDVHWLSLDQDLKTVLADGLN